jgi:hypothetical protein
MTAEGAKAVKGRVQISMLWVWFLINGCQGVSNICTVQTGFVSLLEASSLFKESTFASVLTPHRHDARVSTRSNPSTISSLTWSASRF